ncbi:MAG TPA: class I SAM-dependent methyltransferase [Streptosporangiaceae bacterium]|nr:class I SAM-dependent methyltransferase [Streptosporangiaceae bacterium]
MPRQLRWALRRAYFAPLDLMERFRGDHDGMVPPYGDRFTGYIGHDYIKSGESLAHVLVSYAGLQAGSTLLDIGSGTGRLAVPLTKLIIPPGSYDGLEIVERGVRWCSTRITPAYPHFRFTHANIFNAEYNPGGTAKAAEYVLPYGDASFDVVCLFSVFTHMLTPDVERYVSEISRVLRPGGRLAATFLIINDETTKSMRDGNSIYNFAYHVGPQWLFEEDMAAPELAVGYEEQYVRDLYASNGLDVTGFYLGPWSGQPASPATAPHGQDLVVGTRR